MQENNVKIHCHRLGDIMTEPKLKADKEAGLLGQTAMSYVRDLFLQLEYGYKEPLLTDSLYKGLLCEQDGIDLVCKNIYKKYASKNTKRFENDYFVGTPDLIAPDGIYVDDVKVSENLRTWFECEPTKNNEYQVRGYMSLTGRKKARIIYCLVETPEQIINEQIKRYYFKFNCDDQHPDYLAIEEQIWNNNKAIQKIPFEKRVKVFEFEHDDAIYSKMVEQAKKCQKYYETLKIY